MADLTNINKFKRYARVSLSDNTDNKLINEMIDAASAYIETLTDRKFGAADYREWHDGDGQADLALRQRPIIYVDRIAYGQEDAIDVTYSGPHIRATVQVYEDGIRLRSMAADGTTAANNLTFTDHPSLSTMAAAITAVSNWTGTQQGDDAASNTLHPMGGQKALSRTVTLTRPDEDEDDYRLDRAVGVVRFDGMQIGSGFRNYLVEYRAGYETIPDDIEQACNELVLRLYNEGKRDPNLQSESLGDYSYTLSSVEAVSDSSIIDRLRPYGRVR